MAPAKEVAQLLSLWRKSRAPAVADALDQADGAGPVPVDLREGRIADIQKRVKAPPDDDPRVARALIDLLADTPFTSDGSKPLWNLVFERLEELGDRRLVLRAPDMVKAWGFRKNMRDWLEKKLATCVAAIAEQHPAQPL